MKCKDENFNKKIEQHIKCRDKAFGPKASEFSELSEDQTSCPSKSLEISVKLIQDVKDASDKLTTCYIKLEGVDFTKC